MTLLYVNTIRISCYTTLYNCEYYAKCLPYRSK